MNIYANYDRVRQDFNAGRATFDEVCDAHKKLPKPYTP